MTGKFDARLVQGKFVQGCSGDGIDAFILCSFDGSSQVSVSSTAGFCVDGAGLEIICMDGFEVVAPYLNGNNTGKLEDVDKTLLGATDLIVTCTGNTNVCDANLLQTIKSGAVVCNIGHFDNEIDTQFMRDNWQWEEVKPQVHKIYRSDSPQDYLILLSEGRLVNLGNATGHPSRIMDGSFANQVLAQLHLYEQAWADNDPKQRPPISVDVLPKALDEEVASYMVEGFGGIVSKLTQEQADYINVETEGPFKPETYRY
jgi:adenosylhomocysteinase